MLTAQRRALGLVGALTLVAAWAALLVSCDALVLHEVPSVVQALALCTGALGAACFWRAGRRFLAVVHLGWRAGRAARASAAELVDGRALHVVESPVPEALSIGLLRPRVLLTQAAVVRLEEPALRALVAHEDRHASRRHGLRRTVADAMAAGLGLLPPAVAVRDRYALLLDLDADQAALRRAGGPEGLASLMLSQDAGGRPVDPARIDTLTGDRPELAAFASVLVPALVLLGALVALTLAMISQTHCVDIFYLQEHDATASRWSSLIALTAAAALVLRAARPAAA